MAEKQYEALLTYIDCRIDEKIEDAFGRDALNESVASCEAQQELRELLVSLEDKT